MIVVVMLIVGSLYSLSAVAAGLVSTNSGGSLGYTYRSSSYSSGFYDSQQLLSANVNNTFFIWRDWFVTGSSNLSFTQETTSVQSGGSDSFSSTGSVGFTVLPQSSTPFGFSYSRSDSRVNSSLKGVSSQNRASLDDNVVSDAIVMHQSLIGKGYRLKLKFSDDQFNSTLRGRYGASYLGLSGLLRAKAGMLRMSVSQRNEETYDGLVRDSQVLRLNHGYTGFRQTAITTSISTSNIEQSSKPSSGSTLASYNIALTQASTAVVWRSLDKKITVTSGLRFSEILSATDGAQGADTNTSLSANLGVAYRVTQNLHFFINSARSQNKFASDETVFSSDQLGVSYRSDEIKLGAWSYDWRSDAKVGLREDDGSSSTTSSLGAGHGVARRWAFARSQQIYLRGFQDYSTSSLSDQLRQRLSHRGTFGWKQVLSGINRRAQIQVSDQRDVDGASVMQSASVDLDQQTALTRRIKLNGSLNYQLTSYQYAGSSGDASSSDNSTISMNGVLSYLNPFSIAGMVFTSDYRYSQSVALQDALTVQQAWNNRLNYRVGKIDVSLQYLYREARKISYNVVYFNVKRVF